MSQTFDPTLMTSISVHVQGNMCRSLHACVCACVWLQLAADSDMTNEGLGQK